MYSSRLSKDISVLRIWKRRINIASYVSYHNLYVNSTFTSIMIFASIVILDHGLGVRHWWLYQYKLWTTSISTTSTYQCLWGPPWSRSVAYTILLPPLFFSSPQNQQYKSTQGIAHKNAGDSNWVLSWQAWEDSDATPAPQWIPVLYIYTIIRPTGIGKLIFFGVSILKSILNDTKLWLIISIRASKLFALPRIHAKPWGMTHARATRLLVALLFKFRTNVGHKATSSH